jgi:hypothetical protein
MCTWTQQFTPHSEENSGDWHVRIPVFWRQSQRAQIWPSTSVSINSATDGGIARRGTSYEEKISSARSSIEVSTSKLKLA